MSTTTLRFWQKTHPYFEDTTFFPDDPVVSIVDYELYEYEKMPFGQVKAVFQVLGKLLKRYFYVVTTEKVMNDDYNAFISH